MCYFSETAWDIQSTGLINPEGKFLLPVFPKDFAVAAALLEMSGQLSIKMEALYKWMHDPDLAHMYAHTHTRASTCAHRRSCKETRQPKLQRVHMDAASGGNHSLMRPCSPLGDWMHFWGRVPVLSS